MSSLLRGHPHPLTMCFTIRRASFPFSILRDILAANRSPSPNALTFSQLASQSSHLLGLCLVQENFKRARITCLNSCASRFNASYPLEKLSCLPLEPYSLFCVLGWTNKRNHMYYGIRANEVGGTWLPLLTKVTGLGERNAHKDGNNFVFAFLRMWDTWPINTYSRLPAVVYYM